MYMNQTKWLEARGQKSNNPLQWERVPVTWTLSSGPTDEAPVLPVKYPNYNFTPDLPGTGTIIATLYQPAFLEIGVWESNRNNKRAKVNWQFTTSDARIKLKRLYPIV
jgi:hypothetical protein